MRFSMAATPLSFTEQQRHPFLKSVTKYYAQYSLIISTYALLRTKFWIKSACENYHQVVQPWTIKYEILPSNYLVCGNVYYGWFWYKNFPPITWVQAIRCMSRPPLWPPCFSHLHSHSLSQTIVDEVVEYLTALAVWDASIIWCACQLTKLIEDDCNFLSMLGGEDVGQQGCFACAAMMIILLHIGIWERVWSLIRFVVLTWAQLASYDSDRNLEKCNCTHTTRNYS